MLKTTVGYCQKNLKLIMCGHALESITILIMADVIGGIELDSIQVTVLHIIEYKSEIGLVELRESLNSWITSSTSWRGAGGSAGFFWEVLMEAVVCLATGVGGGLGDCPCWEVMKDSILLFDGLFANVRKCGMEVHLMV